MFQRTKVSLAVLLAAGSGVLPAWAQEAQRIEITGSSIKRLNAETALPVTVISVEELQKQGINTAEQALSRIAANQASFGLNQAVGPTTGAKAEADIRGLSGPFAGNANKTLVLLNGRRIANHAFDAAAVDLNAIPLAAVSRIEVLRDGASALYGTDAIGGVVNFILRRDLKGIEASAEYQMPEAAGGGSTRRANLALGFGDLGRDRYNVMATLDVRRQSALAVVRRPFAKTGVVDPSRAGLTDGTSGTSFPGDLNGFEPSGPNCAAPQSIPRNTNPDNTGAFDSCRYDFSGQVDAIPVNEQRTFLLRGTMTLSADHALTAEYLNANNKATSRVAAVPQSDLMPQSSAFFPAGAPLSVGGIPDLNHPNGPNIPGGIANWRSVPGGPRTSGDDTTTERALIELQGVVSGWDYRTALGQSRNKSAASVKRGYLNSDLIQQGVFDGVINPFGPQTAAGQAAIDAAQLQAETYVGTSKLTFADFKVSGDLLQMNAGPLSAAFGLDLRREVSDLVATDINAVLINSLGIDPDGDISGSRKSYGMYAELAVPVIKGLDLTFAARYDHYSDFGNTFNPKVGIRWQPAREILIRGSYNKGFRAPTLYEIYQPRSLSFTSDSYDDPVLCPAGNAVPPATPGFVCGQQVLQRQVGPVGNGLSRGALSPEKSNTFTVGIVFEPTQRASVGIDYWNIKIKNLINSVPEQEIFSNQTVFASRIVRCSALTPQARGVIDVCLNYPTFDPIAYIDTPTENLGRLNTRGFDLSSSYRFGGTSWGRFGISAEGTYVSRYEYQRYKDAPFIQAVGRYVDSAPVFRWQHVITTTWSSGDWGATLANRYKSGYVDQDGQNHVGSYGVYDASLSWTGIRNMTLTLAVRNILDQDPPRTVQNTTFQRGYDPRFTDPLGRTWVFRVGYQY